jgi:hypothetical protein
MTDSTVPKSAVTPTPDLAEALAVLRQDALSAWDDIQTIVGYHRLAVGLCDYLNDHSRDLFTNVLPDSTRQTLVKEALLSLGLGYVAEHDWRQSQYCSCGQDVVTCQMCGQLVCGSLTAWLLLPHRSGRQGNVCVACQRLYSLA